MVAELLLDGHHVLATDLNIVGLQQAMDGDGWDSLPGRVTLHKLDVTARSDWEAVEAAISKFF